MKRFDCHSLGLKSRLSSACSGFTLVEAMVAIAVLGVLAAIAIPSYDSFILRSRLKTYASDLTAAAKLARSEAVKRGVVVSLCPAKLSAGGVASCSGSDWEIGWAVIASNGTVLRYRGPVAEGYLVDADQSKIDYQANGLGQEMTVTLCRQSPEGNQRRIVTVSAMGRTHIEKDASEDCPDS